MIGDIPWNQGYNPSTIYAGCTPFGGAEVNKIARTMAGMALENPHKMGYNLYNYDEIDPLSSYWNCTSIFTPE